MTEGGFFERRRINAPGLVVVIAMHAVVLTAVALSKMEVVHALPGRTDARFIIEPPVPPPEPTPKPQPTKLLPHVPDTTPPQVVKIKLPVDPTDLKPAKLDLGGTGGSILSDGGPGQQIVDPPRPQARVTASLDTRSELQPPYPPSEERMGTEGIVVVRVLIGADGRVKTVEKVSATSEAFYQATQRQALLHWHFRPATLDGAPVESWQQLTVRFRIPTGDT